MSHKFRSFPVETVLSVMYNQVVDVRGTKKILALLSFMLCDKIDEGSMAKAIKYCAPKLQARFSKYYVPWIQEDIDRLNRTIVRIKRSKSNYKDQRIERALKEFAIGFHNTHAWTASVKNRPFKDEQEEWQAFKNS